MGMKETVSNSYMDGMKREHASKQIRLHRKALVVGSDHEENIGAAIAYRLSNKFDYVQEINKDDGDWGVPGHAANFLEGEDFDTLVLANGRSYLEWIEEQPLEEVLEVLNDSLLASILGAQAFIQETMDKPYRKQIFFIGSMAYKAVLNGSSVYCAAKAGLAQFARCLAWELAPKGYDVFCIHPSNTEGTPMTEETIRGLMRYRGLDRSAAEQYWGAVLPRKEWLQPEDIARIVEFLCFESSGYLSGCQLELGGGQR